MRKSRSNPVSRRKNHSKRRTSSRIKNYFLILSCIVLSLGILASYNIFASEAAVVHAEEHLSDVQYKVVEIQYGESLWSIARDNMGPGYSDLNDYIDEIMLCNQLSDGDSIRAGAKLMIPYYEVLDNNIIVADAH